ncbi:unnamed protein product [Moneuplotes crassus]|uniref:Uncharacterized protein n=1 Tax=Euplotes crassus TaxID=5936 RepID=A0AAD1Y013_EUPCR|nr:unnamed protein product [Moneuplotes crassus]
MEYCSCGMIGAGVFQVLDCFRTEQTDKKLINYNNKVGKQQDHKSVDFAKLQRTGAACHPNKLSSQNFFSTEAYCT